MMLRPRQLLKCSRGEATRSGLVAPRPKRQGRRLYWDFMGFQEHQADSASPFKRNIRVARGRKSFQYFKHESEKNTEENIKVGHHPVAFIALRLLSGASGSGRNIELGSRYRTRAVTLDARSVKRVRGDLRFLGYFYISLHHSSKVITPIITFLHSL